MMRLKSQLIFGYQKRKKKKKGMGKSGLKLSYRGKRNNTIYIEIEINFQ